MIPELDINGNLPKGIHDATWQEITKCYGYTIHRRKLLDGLKLSLTDLKEVGCETVYLDGSFISSKEVPNDFDCCWDETNVDLYKLKANHPIFFDFDNKRKNQKDKYLGEFFPASVIAEPINKRIFLEFFQLDRNGEPKGIIKINLLML